MSSNLGPLTTIFTPPSTCLSITTSGANPQYFSQGYSLFVNNFNGGYTGKNYLRVATSCYPSSTTTIDFWGGYYYSPGYCPSGYTTACSYTGGSFPATATASVCCPKSFHCVDGWPHGCFSAVGRTISNFWIASGPTATPNPASLLTTILDDPVTVWGDGIPVVWERTDSAILALISEASATERAIQTSSSSPGSGIPVLTPVATSPTASTDSSPLSIGAKAGISVGVSCGALILVSILLLALTRRREKQRRYKEDPQLQDGQSEIGVFGLADKRVQTQEMKSSLTAPSSSSPSLLHYGNKPALTEGMHEISELDGSEQKRSELPSVVGEHELSG